MLTDLMFGSNPVRAAYVTSLESQISSLKEELAGLYRTQSQNAQRLLSLTDSLRDKEDEARQESDQRKSLKSEMDRTQRRCQDLEASLKEKENMIVHLNDELQTAQLEFTQLEARNQDLTKDNKNLLQRWLNKMSSEVDQMNEANAFMESTKKSDNGKTPRATSRPTTPERGRRTPNTSTTSHKSSASSKRPATPKLPPSRLPATDSST